MRLIDADALIKDMVECCSPTQFGRATAKMCVKRAPTISPAANWTPCSNGLPNYTGHYKVTVQVGSEIGSWRETMIIPYRIRDGVGEWFPPKSEWKSYSVITWADADEPYRGEA